MALEHITSSDRRDMPADFPESYVVLGCVEAEKQFRASNRTIRRWMREYGEEDLIHLRRSYLRKLAASKGVPNACGSKPGRRYGGFPEMRSTNPALNWMPIRRSRRSFPEENVWIRFPDGQPRPKPYFEE